MTSDRPRRTWRPGTPAQWSVIATRLRAGETMIRVLSDGSPGIGFTSSEPGLEDVYFATLFRHRAAAEPVARAA